MIITIKKACIKDLELLLKWRIIVLKDVFSNSQNVDYEYLYEMNEKYYRSHLVNDTHTAIFAINEENEIVGCGGICYHDEMPSPDNVNGKCGYLMNIYVLPKYRHNGIGKKIVEFLVEEAKKIGIEKIYLESSQNAKNMYLELGFKDMQGYLKL